MNLYDFELPVLAQTNRKIDILILNLYVSKDNTQENEKITHRMKIMYLIKVWYAEYLKSFYTLGEKKEV